VRCAAQSAALAAADLGDGAALTFAPDMTQLFSKERGRGRDRDDDDFGGGSSWGS
jgi:hypothetical protein